MDLNHATKLAHYWAMQLGIPVHGGHSGAASMFRGLDETAVRRKLVEVVATLRHDSTVTASQTGRALIDYADHLRRELAELDALAGKHRRTA